MVEEAVVEIVDSEKKPMFWKNKRFQKTAVFVAAGVGVLALSAFVASKAGAGQVAEIAGTIAEQATEVVTETAVAAV